MEYYRVPLKDLGFKNDKAEALELVAAGMLLISLIGFLTLLPSPVFYVTAARIPANGDYVFGLKSGNFNYSAASLGFSGHYSNGTIYVDQLIRPDEALIQLTEYTPYYDALPLSVVNQPGSGIRVMVFNTGYPNYTPILWHLIIYVNRLNPLVKVSGFSLGVSSLVCGLLVYRKSRRLAKKRVRSL